MATLRNLAISLLYLAGVKEVTEADGVLPADVLVQWIQLTPSVA